MPLNLQYSQDNGPYEPLRTQFVALVPVYNQQTLDNLNHTWSLRISRYVIGSIIGIYPYNDHFEWVVFYPDCTIKMHMEP